MSFFFKNYSLVKVICHVFIRSYKARFFLGNTNNTDRNGVNKPTHTPNTEIKTTLEKVS